jgi:hypothetical protein
MRFDVSYFTLLASISNTLALHNYECEVIHAFSFANEFGQRFVNPIA